MPSNNLEMIKTIAHGLKELNDRVVYVGGAVSELYATNAEIADIVRATDDVDVIVKVESRFSFNKLEEELREKGFANDLSTGAPICRWVYQNVKLDVMPDDSNVLGFTNKWYGPGMNNKVSVQIENELSINILSSLYYLATKFEAIDGRGRIDLRTSHDFEDVVFVFDTCDSIENDFKRCEQKLKRYIRKYIKGLQLDPAFKEALMCALPRGAEDRLDEVLARMINL